MNYSSEHIGGANTFGGLPRGGIIRACSSQSSAPWSFFIDYGLFKLAPTSIKQYVYDNGNWLISFWMRKSYPPAQHGDDVRLLELFEKNAIVSDGKNEGVYRFFHFFIPHPYWYIDENLRYDPSLHGAEAYCRQTRGAMKLAARMLQKLRKLGIYDSSEIVIMGDHGTQNLRPLAINVSLDNIFAQVPLTTCASSYALMLHKKPGSTGPLVTNDAPICSSDLPCLLGIEDKNLNCSEFNLAMAGAERDRRFLHYRWAQEYWEKDFMPAMTEYFVKGHAYDYASWRKGNFRYAGGKKVPLGHETVKLGVPMHINAEEAHDIFRNGWSAQESKRRWTDGSIAGLELNVQDARGKDLLLRLYANCLVPQVVNLRVNDHRVATWRVDGDKWYEASIPADVAGEGFLKMIFTISNPTAPCEISASDDCRKLGIAAKEMVIEEDRGK